MKHSIVAKHRKVTASEGEEEEEVEDEEEEADEEEEEEEQNRHGRRRKMGREERRREGGGGGVNSRLRNLPPLLPFYSSPDLGVAITMEQEEQLTPTTALPTAALLTTNPAAAKNPLRRLASKSSIKMLFHPSSSEQAETRDATGWPANVATGVTAPYYPIFLPIDQDFKAKYIWHHRMAKRGKSLKEKTYAFLEHPGGWLCFTYHISV